MSDEYNSRQARRRQRKQKPRFQQWGLGKKILISLCLVFLLAIIGCGIATAVIIHNAPTLKASELSAPLSTRIYDKDGELVSTVFHQENRVKVHLKDVPKTMQDAVISIEDKRFYHHHGVDFHRLFGAIAANLKNGWGAEGGSTITQQVVKRSVLSPEKTLTRKIQEAWLSLKLERKYSKDQILEMYLNNVYYGHGAYGLKTAAKTYFGEKDLSKLNVSQMALLAGLPNSPSADDPFKHPKRAQERRNQVLSAMASNKAISKQEAAKAKGVPIDKTLVKTEKKQKNNDPYNAFVDTLYDQLVKRDKTISEKQFFQGGLKIYTTLDPKAQRSVYHLIRSEDIPYPDKNFETGLSLVDTKSGAVRAVGGGRNFKSLTYTNYGSHVKNQPGSTIKPVLDYGPAIEYLHWPTSHTLTDEHYAYSDGTTINEWDNKYWGSMSIRRALQWSRNIPALKAFQSVGKDKAQKFAKGLGINIDPIYESAAIGGFDGVSPLQMAEAYAAFGNGGVYHEPYAVNKITFPSGKEIKPKTESRTAMHDYTAYMITDMLKTVISSGTGTQANLSGIPVAGKTGSTNIPKDVSDKYGLGDGLLDSWFAGYTTQYSLAVWTGYPSLKNKKGDVQYIQYDGSQNIAQQLFHQLMTDISDPNTADFKRPDTVASSGSELYVAGAQPKNVPSQEKKPSGSSTPKQDQGEQKQEEEKEQGEEQQNQSEDQKDQSKPKQEKNNQQQEQNNQEQKQNDQEQENEEQNKEDHDRDENNQDQDNKQQNDDQSDQDPKGQDQEQDHQKDNNGDDANKGDSHEKEDQGSEDQNSEDQGNKDNNDNDHNGNDNGNKENNNGNKDSSDGGNNGNGGNDKGDNGGNGDHDNNGGNSNTNDSHSKSAGNKKDGGQSKGKDHD